MELKDIEKPKWVLSTKRGWGMVLTFASTLLPMANMWLAPKGIQLDAPMVALVGEAGSQLIDTVGMCVGVVLWVWGSFRPTAQLSVTPPK